MKQLIKSKQQVRKDMRNRIRKEKQQEEDETHTSQEVQTRLIDPVLAQRAQQLNSVLLQQETDGSTEGDKKTDKQLNVSLVALSRRLSKQRAMVLSHKYKKKDLVVEAQKITEQEAKGEGEEYETFVHFNKEDTMDRGPSTYTEGEYKEVEPVLMYELAQFMDKKEKKKRRKEEEDDEDNSSEKKESKNTSHSKDYKPIMKRGNKRLRQWQFKQMGARDEAFVQTLLDKYGRKNVKVC